MNRGLKGEYREALGGLDEVTVTSPMNRGLKEHALRATHIKGLGLQLLPR